MPAPITDPGRIPGPQFIPNCIALRLVWQLPNGKQASNIMHAVYDNTPLLTQTVVNTVGAGVNTALTASGLLTYLHTETQFVGIGIRDASELVPPGGVGHAEFLSDGDPEPGASPSPTPLPANVSFVVSLRTPQAGQQGRGRVYIPGWASNANDTSGRVVAAAADAAVAFIQAIDDFLSATTYGWPLCVGHPARQEYTSERTGTVHPARAAGTVDVVNILRRDLVWDTQRLRNRL